MGATQQLRSNTLRLEDNVPQTVVLKYGTGHRCANGRIMFTFMSGEQIFLAPGDAHKIHALGLDPNEPFEIMKRVVNGETAIIVSRVRAQQPVARPAAAATSESSTFEDRSQLPHPQDNSLAGLMASAYISAISALRVASDYAQKYQLSFRITEEEIRTCAHAIFIECGRSKDRDVREREFEARYGAQKNGGGSWQR